MPVLWQRGVVTRGCEGMECGAQWYVTQLASATIVR